MAGSGINRRRQVFLDTEVELDSPPTTMSSSIGLSAIVEERPTRLPLHAPPERTSSQERFRSFGHPFTPMADTPHTVSTPQNMALVFSHLQNMSDEELNRLPEDVYKSYIEEKADKIVQKVVPESLNEVNRLMSQQQSMLPSLAEELMHTGLSDFPKQSTLYPLAKDQFEIGQDGRYFETRNYNRVEDLGEGGFGMVYACMDNCKESLFAIKCNNQSSKVSSMKRECEVLFYLGHHSKITRFLGSLLEDYGSEVQGQSLKMLMECAINGSLDDMLVDPESETQKCGLPLNQSLYYLQQILCGVDFLHQHDTLHLDLKCKNILVFDEGRIVKLADFGTAMRREEVSLKGSLEGFTPNYSAPEVVNGCELPSYSADVWSVMCVLVEMCTGTIPWCWERDHNTQSIILMVGNYNEAQHFKDLVPVNNQEYELSDEIIDLMKQVLIKDPKLRPSAKDLLNTSVMVEAVEYEKQFDDLMSDVENDGTCCYEECNNSMPVDPNLVIDTKGHSFPQTFTNHRASVGADSGYGRSLPDRLSSVDSSIPPPRTPSIGSTRYQILRHESAPFITIPAKNFMKFDEISAHFKNNANITIPTDYIQKGVLHTCNSAPSGMWTMSHHQRVCGMIPRGDDDSERDGPCRRQQGVLKGNPSAQYVSNGPEVDSPDGRRARLHPSSPIIASDASGTVSVGTQTSLSPTVEGVPPFPGPQTIYYYNESQTSIHS